MSSLFYALNIEGNHIKKGLIYQGISELSHAINLPLDAGV